VRSGVDVQGCTPSHRPGGPGGTPGSPRSAGPEGRAHDPLVDLAPQGHPAGPVGLGQRAVDQAGSRPDCRTHWCWRRHWG
jgi:hypothetical protein